MIKVEITFQQFLPILDNARGKKILAESKSKVSNDDSSGLPFRNKNSSIHRLYTAENLECYENLSQIYRKKRKIHLQERKNYSKKNPESKILRKIDTKKKKVTQFVHKTHSFPIFNPIPIFTRQLTRSSTSSLSPFHPQKDRKWKENARELLARERNDCRGEKSIWSIRGEGCRAPFRRP